MNPVEEIFKILKSANPNPTTELRYNSHFQLLIAVILSAQATDRSVNQATEKLFALAPDAASMAKLSQKQLEQSINSIGLYRNKAKFLSQTAAILLEKYQGQVPQLRQDLEALPGVGRKTANVILNTAFGKATIAVDTHIYRLAHRLQLSTGKTPHAVEKDLEKKIPKPYLQHAHHWLILHGRYICTARKPKCYACSINTFCLYEPKTRKPHAPTQS
jgi:endonuclease III